MKDLKYLCQGCDEFVDKIFNDYGYNLCEECNNNYDNKTGYCSLFCCVTGQCDESC